MHTTMHEGARLGCGYSSGNQDRGFHARRWHGGSCYRGRECRARGRCHRCWFWRRAVLLPRRSYSTQWLCGYCCRGGREELIRDGV